MTGSTADLTINTLGPDGVHELRHDLLQIYSEAYADRLDRPFYAPQRYWERIQNYATRDGYTLAVGYAHSQLAGYAMGFTLPANTGWWDDLTTPVDPDDITEDGSRTYVLNELMVRPTMRQRGYSRSLHDALLSGRPEKRATLLVRPDNHPARPAYLRWGWHKLGEIQPFPDSPRYDALILDLESRQMC